MRATPRSLRLVVAGRCGTFTGEPFALAAAGAKVDLGTCTLRAPVVVEGVVRDAAQRPVAGQSVWLLTIDPGPPRLHPPIEHVETLTDREGRYRFVGVAPGPVWLQLRADGWPARTVTVDHFAAVPGDRCTRDLVVR
jgi:protocatechuate 3,4-dioxygenase beta subunit